MTEQRYETGSGGPGDDRTRELRPLDETAAPSSDAGDRVDDRAAGGPGSETTGVPSAWVAPTGTGAETAPPPAGDDADAPTSALPVAPEGAEPAPADPTTSTSAPPAAAGSSGTGAAPAPEDGAPAPERSDPAGPTDESPSSDPTGEGPSSEPTAGAGRPAGAHGRAPRRASGLGAQDLTAAASALAGSLRTARRPPRSAAPAAARTRRARLQLRRVDVLSVFLLALLLSLFLAIVIVVAVVALYAVLAAAGVPGTINDLVAEITRATGEAALEPEPLLTARRAVVAAGVVAAVDVVLLTALATLGALLYNLCASFTGGLTVTLAEPEER